MYCSSCGGAVQSNRTYCNHCGALLNTKHEATKSSELSPVSLVWAIVATFVFGLGTIVGLIAVLRNIEGINFGVILFITLLSFLLMTLIEVVFVWLLFGKRQAKTDTPSIKGLSEANKALPDAEMRGLPEPLTSVTDQTTRSFDPAFVERRTK